MIFLGKLIPSFVMLLAFSCELAASPISGGVLGGRACKISMARHVALSAVVSVPNVYTGNTPDKVTTEMKAWANYFMRLASNARVNAKALSHLQAEMISVAQSNRLAWPKGWDRGEHRPSSVIYHTMEAVFPYAVAYAQFKDTFSNSEQRAIEKWLGAIVDRIGRSKKMNFWKLDNKKYQFGALAAAFGYASGQKKYLSKASSIYKTAIRGQRKDGSLPGDSGRGGNALHYTNLALANLTAIAEFASDSGINLYGYRSGNKSLHSAIAFLAAATRSPQLIAGYAAEQTGSSFKQYSAANLDRRWADKSAASWGYYYLRRFGTTSSGKQLRAASGYLRRNKAGVHQQSGGNARCFVG